MRLVTRGDADGLCCAVLLRYKKMIRSIEFVHPKEMREGKIRITGDDIIANLPYHPDCGMWFDHHASSEELAKRCSFDGKFRIAPSAARVIREFYDDPGLDRFRTLLEATDKMDSADLSPEDVDRPHGYMLLMYSLDPRTGLGEFKEYFLNLLDWILEKPLEEVLLIPAVKERCDRILEKHEEFRRTMKSHSRLEGNVIVTDLRDIHPAPIGNRFLVFSLFPEGNVQARVFQGRNREYIVVALGHSIFNRTCTTDLGAVANRYGGGGHKGAATCQLPPDRADELIAKIISDLKALPNS